MSARLRLTIAYDGAPFAGWQSQRGGNTIQDHLETALEKIAGGRVPLHGAGRTDAGVHALGQSAHFDVPANLRLDSAAWARALNSNLPSTIRVLGCRKASPDFHARFSATGKIYRYEICSSAVLPPHRHQRAWHVPRPIDLDALRDTLALFVGTHDFNAFSANRGQAPASTVRTVRSIKMTRRGRSLRLTFEGNGFLYKMVRMLVGAALRVALGRESRENVQRRLDHPGSARWNFVAPADGLYLVRVLYQLDGERTTALG